MTPIRSLNPRQPSAAMTTTRGPLGIALLLLPLLGCGGRSAGTWVLPVPDDAAYVRVAVQRDGCRGSLDVEFLPAWPDRPAAAAAEEREAGQ